MKRPSRPANTDQIKAKFEARVSGDDPAYERTRTALRWLAGGWGDEFDLRDLHLVADPSGDEAERTDAIQRLSDGLAEYWKPRGAVDFALHRSGEDRAACKRRAVNIGLMQASLAGRERQEMRFSDIAWLKDSDGRKVSAIPETEIGWIHYTVFLRQKALRLAGEWLVQEFGEPGVIREGPQERAIEIEVDSDRVQRVQEDRGSPMPLLDEVSSDTKSLLELITDEATTRQREIIDLYLRYDGDTSKVADNLGISRQNINEQLKRLRARVLMKDIGAPRNS